MKRDESKTKNTTVFLPFLVITLRRLANLRMIVCKTEEIINEGTQSSAASDQAKSGSFLKDTRPQILATQSLTHKATKRRTGFAAQETDDWRFMRSLNGDTYSGFPAYHNARDAGEHIAVCFVLTHLLY